MIVSGDESVLYPISLLMFRNYTVFLVVPDENSIPCFQATRVFSWYQDVLSCISNLDTEQSTSASGMLSPPQRSVTSGHRFPPSRPPVPFTTSAMTPESKDDISLPHHPTLPVWKSPQASAFSNLGNNHAEEVPATLKSSNPSKHNEIQPSQVPKPISEEPARQSEVDDWGASGGWSTSGGWTMTGANWDSNPVSPAPKPDVKPKKPQREPKAASVQQPKATQPPPKKSQSGPSSVSAQASHPGEKPRSPASNPAFEPLLEILRQAENQSMKRSQLGEHLAKRKGLYSLAGANGFSGYIELAVKYNLVMLRGVDGLQTVKLKKKV